MGRRKNNIKYLVALLQRLSRAERNLLSQLFASPETKNRDQCGEMLELLLVTLDTNLPDPSEAAAETVYQRFSPEIVSNLSSRIISRIYESLLLDVNLKRKGAHSPYGKTYVQVNKKILQIQLLWGRGLMKKVPALIDQVEKQSRKFELYKELVRVLELKQEFNGLRRGPDFYHEMSREIEMIRAQEAGLYKARRYYYLIMLQNEQELVGPNQLIQVEGMLTELKALRNNLTSQRLEYYINLLEVDRLEKAGNYKAAILSCRKVWERVRDFEALYSRKRMGTTFLQLAHLHLREHENSDAVRYVEIARTYFPTDSFNHKIAAEIRFLAYFYDRKWALAEDALFPLLNGVEENNERFRVRWNSCRAALLFQQGAIGDALMWLQEYGLVRNLRGEWNIANRVLEIILLIEKNRLDQIEYSLDALRKHLSRFAKMESEAFMRWQLIFNLLKTLNKHSFSFDKTCQDHSQSLQKLSGTAQPFGWQPRSAELIPFQDWFEEKRKAEERGEWPIGPASSPTNKLKFNFFDR